MTKFNKDSRIAIIGAGPSGLAAAEALRAKGYTNITLFDKSKRVGGMSYSCEYETTDGKKLVYDIGSVQPLSSKNLLRLLKKYKLHLGRGHLAKKSKLIVAYDHVNDRELLNYVKYYFGVPWSKVPLMMLDVLKLSRYLWRYRRLAKPGFHNFKYWEETTIDFRQWVEDRKFHILGDRLPGLINNLMTLSNKQREEEVNVFTVFKFLYQMLQFPFRYIDGTYRPIKEGYQELWKRVAKQYQVELNCQIQSIERTDSGGTISTFDKTYQFDKLIISCPFDKLNNILDVRPIESTTFTDIVYYPGYRGAFVAKNAPNNGIFWYPESYDSAAGPPYLSLLIPEAKIDEETYLYSCVFAYCEGADVVGQLQKSTETVLANCHDAEVTEWVRIQYWEDYGCVFGPKAVENRVYDKVQAMQGNFDTFYVGQLISFSAHSTVVDYSYELVKKHF